jgi:hypothetical protein
MEWNQIKGLGSLATLKRETGGYLENPAYTGGPVVVERIISFQCLAALCS